MLTTVAHSQSQLQSQAKPQRIVSMNLCADQLLMLLVDRSRIQSLSNLANDPNLSAIADQVGDIPLNEGRVEHIITMRPDLVIAGRYTTTEANLLLQRLGYRVEMLNMAMSIEDIEHNIDWMAQLTATEEKGKQLIHDMRQRLARASQLAARKPRRLAVVYSPNGFTSGKNTLSNQAMNLAGLDNLAVRKGIEIYGTLSLETLLKAEPELVIINDGTINQYSLAQRQLKHPALTHWLKQRKVIRIPPQFWICGGPIMADAVDYLLMQ